MTEGMDDTSYGLHRGGLAGPGLNDSHHNLNRVYLQERPTRHADGFPTSTYPKVRRLISISIDGGKRDLTYQPTISLGIIGCLCWGVRQNVQCPQAAYNADNQGFTRRQSSGDGVLVWAARREEFTQIPRFLPTTHTKRSISSMQPPNVDCFQPESTCVRSISERSSQQVARDIILDSTGLAIEFTKLPQPQSAALESRDRSDSLQCLPLRSHQKWRFISPVHLPRQPTSVNDNAQTNRYNGLASPLQSSHSHYTFDVIAQSSFRHKLDNMSESTRQQCGG